MDPQPAGHFLPPLFGRHTVIAMRESNRLGEAVQNFTSLSTLAWTVDSTVMQPANCIKGQPT